MALKHLVLGILRQEPAHGYRVASRLVALAGAVRRVEPARVYETLGALEREGSIALAPDPPDGRGRRVWETTAKGREELDRWLERPVPSADWLRRPLLVRLAVAGPEHPARTEAARAELQARRRALARLEAEIPRGRANGAAVAPAALHEALARADRERELVRLRAEVELLEGWLDIAAATDPVPQPGARYPAPGATGRTPGPAGGGSPPGAGISRSPRTSRRPPTGASSPSAPRSAPASR